MSQLRLHILIVDLCFLSLLCIMGCGPDYDPIEAGQIRAFRVPVVETGTGASETLCLFSVPQGYTPDRSWPMVVALHGYGSSARLFHDLWQRVTVDAGYVLLTPQGPEQTAEGVGWSWGFHPGEILRRSIDTVRGIVRIDPQGIFLSGFSQGGKLAYRFGLEHPHVFRGIALLGTYMDPDILPSQEKARLVDGLRVYIGRGEEEPNSDAARDASARLRDLGCIVHFVEYPNVGHGLPEPREVELRHILDFLGATESKPRNR